MPAVSPGWYPEPSPEPGLPPSLRYWDGERWTEHAAPVAATGPTTPVAATPDGAPLAGWWWRVLAHVIDTFIVSVVGGILTLPVQVALLSDLAKVEEDFLHGLETNPEAFPPLGQFYGDMLGVYQDRLFWLVAPGLVISLAYVGGMLRWKGATPGKLALGLQVRLRDAPGRLPWSTIMTRWLIQFGIMSMLCCIGVARGSWILAGTLFGVGTVFFYLDGLWATWDVKKQALHDKAARTNVVRTR
jgi:uncharacterized RDD family membrane protein YckC